ncbi:hypothetical protein ACTID9_06325 [Brevibacillus fluminis]|uniref:hypothetical protein n=1 Tax=Brevibacillus fluminis TaxID=511487 RepID=UPI003F88633D
MEVLITTADRIAISLFLSLQIAFLFIGIAGLIAAIAALFVQEAYADREEVSQAAG